MSELVSALALWLADLHLLTCALLAIVLAALPLLRQPAQRMAIAKSTLAALTALGLLCALPGWSVVHLVSADARSATVAAASEPPSAEPLAPPIAETGPQPRGQFAPTASPGQPVPPSPAAPRQPTFSWPAVSWSTVLVLVQALGTAGVIAWLAGGAIVVRSVRRASRPASEELQSLLAKLLPAPPAPALLVSDRIATPVALGLVRPAIVLPAALAGPAEGLRPAGPGPRGGPARFSTNMTLAAVLAHELAHIAAGDLRTLAASRWLLVVLWPQPLFWLLRRVMRHDQETLADAAAAEVAGRIDYAEQLLTWARTAAPRAPRLAGAVGLWEGPSQLKRRIATLLDEKLTVLRQASRRWRIGTACAALAAAGMLSLVSVQREVVSDTAPTGTLLISTALAKHEDPAVAATGAFERSSPEFGERPAGLDRVGAPAATTLSADNQIATGSILNTLSPTWGIQAQPVPESATFTSFAANSSAVETASTGSATEGELAAAPTSGAAAPDTGARGETTHSVVGSGTFVAVEAAEEAATGADANKIAVRCLDAAGAPLAGVRATLYRTNFRAGSHELVAEASTTASGDVQFTGPVSAERLAEYKTLAAAAEFNDAMYRTTYLIALRSAGVATTMLFAQEYEVALRGHRTEVKLGPAQKLSGRVTNDAGQGVANALVAAGSYASNFVIEGVNAVRTDAEGRYEFNDRPPLDAKAVQERMQSANTFALAAANYLATAQPPRPEVGVDWSASDLVVTHPDFAVTTQQGGDIPGTVDVVMLPAAAIAGRVVQFTSGAPAAGMLVRVMSHPEPRPNPTGSVAAKPAGGGTPLMNAHAASTRTDALGRYRLGNLPAGRYDVWAAPNADDPGEGTLTNTGVSQLTVRAGAEPTIAPDLLIGPGLLLRVQLVNATTGAPLNIPQGGRVVVAASYIGGPQMQDRSQPRVDVSPEGRFECRVAPGKLRLSLLIYAGTTVDGEPDFMTADDSYTTGPTIEGAHGSVVDVAIEAWPKADIDKIREFTHRAFTLRNEEKWSEAVAAASEALRQYPDQHGALLARALSYEKLGQLPSAIADYERVLVLSPGDGNALMRLAGILATARDPAVRNGARAVQLATELVASFRDEGYREGRPAVHSVLAAAFAEAGDFEKAVAAQQEALRSAPDERRAEMESRLRLYESGQPYRRE